MRQDLEFFQEREMHLLYIGKQLDESLELEALLTATKIDYYVEVDHYVGGFLFRRERAGAFFYVTLEQLAQARAVMIDNRYQPYEPAGEDRSSTG